MSSMPQRAWRRRRTVITRLVELLNRLSPFWGPQALVATVIVLQFVLPEKLTVGPVWLLPSVEGLLLVGLVFFSPNERVRHSPLRRHVAIGLTALVSAVNAVSVILLAHYMLHGHVKNGRQLLFSGLALWATNVLVFALWYYEIDRGGPVARTLGEKYYPDFLFAQMTTEGQENTPPNWKPGLTDYLYLAFTNATAFSPTDTMPLTATAKWLMSLQAMVSLILVILVVSRAIGIIS